MGLAAWLNGLAEAASELRRHLLDRLRAGDVARGEELLGSMEDVYDLLVTVEYPDAITGGLRRTTDRVARRVGTLSVGRDLDSPSIFPAADDRKIAARKLRLHSEPPENLQGGSPVGGALRLQYHGTSIRERASVFLDDEGPLGDDPTADRCPTHESLPDRLDDT